MDGILVIDKSAGGTSHDVVARVRRRLGTRRVGHTGTLDPFATGVLVVLVGKATRLAQFLDKDEKEYEAVIRFGFETDTGDMTGEPLSPVSDKTAELADVDWDKILAEFRGETEQVPPMYSAKKIDGRKLYEYARLGKEVTREPVAITIRELTALGGVRTDADGAGLPIKVACSAGTYIRTLAVDIGRRVGVGAHLAALRRTRAGRFSIDSSISADDVTSADLLPVELAVSHLAAFDVTRERVAATLNGLSTRSVNCGFADKQPVRMVGPDGELLAVGIFAEQEVSVRPRVVLG